MKLLIVTQKVDRHDPVLGFFHAWLERFAGRCEKVSVICLEKGDYDFPTNVGVYSLGKEQRASLIVYVARFYMLIWRLRHEYDVVFVHMNPEYILLGATLWHAMGKRVALWYTHKSVDLKLRIAEKLVDRIFTASKESFRLPSEKLEIVGHGIDVDHFAAKPYRHERLRMLTVGRVAEAKDLQTLILGVGAVREDDRNAAGGMVFDIVGSPVLREDRRYQTELVHLVHARKLDPLIRFLGEKTYAQLPEIYRDHDLFLHASRTGSMDKAVLEALATGLTVITSSEAYTGFPEGIFHFQQGDPRDLARAIKEVGGRGSMHKSEQMQDFIRKRYGLPGLIDRILASLSAR